MDKILKAADDIAAVFNITQGWLDPGRSAVVKILKQLVEEKITSTNKPSSVICADTPCVYCDHTVKKCNGCKDYSHFVGRKLRTLP